MKALAKCQGVRKRANDAIKERARAAFIAKRKALAKLKAEFEAREAAERRRKRQKGSPNFKLIRPRITRPTPIQLLKLLVTQPTPPILPLEKSD